MTNVMAGLLLLACLISAATGTTDLDIANFGVDQALVNSSTLNMTTCLPEWEVMLNKNGRGSTSYVITNTPSDCQAACIEVANCVAVDFDMTDDPVFVCWLHLNATETYDCPQVTHYRLRNRCRRHDISLGSSLRPTHETVTNKDCLSWNVEKGIHLGNGILLSRLNTLEECLEFCLNNSGVCVAVNIDYSYSPAVVCWLHMNMTDLLYPAVAENFVSYELIDRCKSYWAFPSMLIRILAPKSAAGTSSPSVSAETGFKREAGDTGHMGATGPTGRTGATGARGNFGSTGATGRPGAIGLHGSFGATGATGNIGHTGSSGLPGFPGATGLVGPIGMTGMTGYPGPVGDTGATGLIGSTGSTGPMGWTGPAGPPGQIERNVEFQAAFRSVGPLGQSRGCRPLWISFLNTTSIGGKSHVSHNTANLEGCKKFCLAKPSCVAVDWDRNSFICLLHSNESHIDKKHFDSKRDQYILQRQCQSHDSGAVAAETKSSANNWFKSNPVLSTGIVSAMTSLVCTLAILIIALIVYAIYNQQRKHGQKMGLQSPSGIENLSSDLCSTSEFNSIRSKVFRPTLAFD